MKPEDIDKLEAGRELDALVLKAVFGIEPQECMVGGHPPGCPGNVRNPPYSADIAAAWLVVEKLRETGFTHLDLRFHGGRWGMVGYYDMSTDDFRPTTWADTAPLAICRAALKAIAGEQQQEGEGK